jgi:hypothetical protein
MYKHSNEIEEVAVVNLSGVNLENSPEMEALLGVRTISHNTLVVAQRLLSETLYLHAIHIFELIRIGRAVSEGTHLMDF